MTEESSIGWYIKDEEEPLLVAVKNSNTINKEDVVTPKIYDKNERC